MFQIFIFLSYYEATEYIKGDSDLTFLSKLEYGFKKNAFITFDISNLKIPSITFGFATKDEIKSIKTPDKVSCSASGIAELIFYIYDGQSFNLTIPSKKTLTPFVLSCTKSYYFDFQINITNGKNQLDNRCQTAMIYSLVFGIIYLVTGVSFLVYCLISKKKQPSIYITILIFIFSISLEEIFFYVYFTENDDKEYSEKLFFDAYYILMTVFRFISLILISIFNMLFHHYVSFLSRNQSNITNYYFIGISSFIALIVSFISQFFKENYFNHIVSASFYLIFAAILFLIPSRISFSRAAVILFISGSFFTFSLRTSLLIEAEKSMNVYVMFIGLNLASIIIQILSILLLIIGFIVFHDTDFKSIVLNINQELNYSDEEQHLEFLSTN